MKNSAAETPGRGERLGWLLLLVVLALAIFQAGIHSGWFGDDLTFAVNNPGEQIFDYFDTTTPESRWYRPLVMVYLLTSQSLFGDNPLPIHLGQILLHAVFCWALYLFVLRMGFGRAHAVIASLYMLACQVTAYPVLAIDTVGQMTGSFFGFICLWMLYESYGPSGVHTSRPGLYIAALVLFILSLLSKEASSGFFGHVLLLIALVGYLRRDEGQRIDVKRLALQLAPFVIALAGYMILRKFAGGESIRISTDTYAFYPGLNIPTNILQFLLAATVPISSVVVYMAVQSRDLIVLSIAGAVALILAALVLYGLWKSPRRGIILVLAAGALVAMFPMAGLNHISEMYIYNSLPFLACLTGIGLGTLLLGWRRRSLPWVALVVFLVVLAGIHVRAIYTKAQHMNYNGQRAAAMLEALYPLVEYVPAGGSFLLLNPPDDDPEYSVFVMDDFNVLKWSTVMFYRHAGRSDFFTHVIDGPIDTDTLGPKDMVITIEGDQLRVVHAPDDSPYQPNP